MHPADSTVINAARDFHSVQIYGDMNTCTGQWINVNVNIAVMKLLDLITFELT